MIFIKRSQPFPPSTPSATTSNSRRSSWTTRWPRDRPPRSTLHPQVEGALGSSSCLHAHHSRNHSVLRRPLPLLPPIPTMAAKVRGRGKARTTAPMAPATTAVTIAGVPRCCPPSTIPGPAPSRCGQECVLRSSSRVHHNTPTYYRAPGGPSFTPLPGPPPHQQQAAAPAWSPLTDAWDQQSLANFFNAMALTPPTVTNLVADSGVSNHTTSDAGNLTSVHPPTFIDPSSNVVGNGSSLPVTSVGDSALPDPFYLNNVLVTPDIIQNLLSVRHFTTDNWCSMEFDPFGPSVKDLYAERYRQMQ
jgi:hypothetical protein